MNIVRWAGVLKSSAKKRMSSLDCAAIVKGSTALGNAKAAGKVLDISAVQNAVAAKRAEKAAQLEDLMHQAESWQRTETEEEIDRKLKEIFQRIMTNDEYNTSPSTKETSSLARRGASQKCHRSPSAKETSSLARRGAKKETSSLARRSASVRQGIFSSDANAALPYSLLSGRSLDSSALRASERDDNNISALRASERDDSKNNKCHSLRCAAHHRIKESGLPTRMRRFRILESVDPLTIATQSRDDSKNNKKSKKKMNTHNDGGYHA